MRSFIPRRFRDLLQAVLLAGVVLAGLPGQRWVVLGEMRELGPDAASIHEDAGRSARLLGIDRLYTLGAMAGHAADGYGEQAQRHERIDDLVGKRIEARQAKDFAEADRIRKALVAEGVDPVLIDSAVAPADALTYPWENPAGLRDLVYSRLLPVRQSIGQFLSVYPPALLIDGLRTVSIGHDASLAAEGRVLSCWLQRRLAACGADGRCFLRNDDALNAWTGAVAVSVDQSELESVRAAVPGAEIVAAEFAVKRQRAVLREAGARHAQQQAALAEIEARAEGDPGTGRKSIIRRR